MSETYGKFESGGLDSFYMIIMEYNEFYPHYMDMLPEGLSNNEELTTYLSTDKILEQYA